MTNRKVISYLYTFEVYDNDVAKSPLFDFRIHEVSNVISNEQIAESILADRGEIPADCFLDWY
jgi:hypothetical protein